LIMNFLVQPLFFLSGALFPINNLPKVFSYIISFDPLTYGVDGIRGSLTGITHFGLTTDLIVLGVLTAMIVTIGSYLFSKIQL
ncbi:MAG TPA: ABC transporter permease, partial [Candidatus Saccharimonadales bacterium]|nr:ABC transporter permease [Candidatus Saccharimonadales bacterium]